MKQILQSLKTGEIEIADVPCPQPRARDVLIATHVSLISTGTERAVLEFGRRGWIGKALQQPDKVRQSIEKAKTDGLFATMEAISSKLDRPLPLGYCNVGRVIKTGDGVTEFAVGDRVVSNGPHAEVVCVPKSLCAKVPDEVADDRAVFTVLGAVALHGLRLAAPTLGECFVVSGLGVVGLLAVQLLSACGCRVLAIDLARERLRLAEQFGAKTFDLSRDGDLIGVANSFSRGRGVDGVLITASTSSSEPIRQAARMSRKKGRVVLVGVVGMELPRDEFYHKELSFQVSCSYGPGRYDPHYEAGKNDYPLAFVRWCAQRNFEAVLDMLTGERVNPEPIITARFPIDESPAAYKHLAHDGTLGIVLDYDAAGAGAGVVGGLRTRLIECSPRQPQVAENRSGSLTSAGACPSVRFIGAGEFATRVLIPAFKSNGARLERIASANGLTSIYAARKFGFSQATTDLESVVEAPGADAIVVATRHDSHADYVCRAIAAGKHVFVEKPLALSHRELENIVDCYNSALSASRPPVVLVGFNRRFASQVRRMADLLSGLDEPKTFIMTVNAGPLASDHWLHDRRVGGGRIIGEACHFIDLLRFLCGNPIAGVRATTVGATRADPARQDQVSITLDFADGSMGTVHYLASGHRSFPKERLEVFCGGRVLQLDNFRRLRAYGWRGFRKMFLARQDKGHTAEVAAFVDAVARGGASPVPFGELIEVSLVCLQVAEQAAQTGQPQYESQLSSEFGRCDGWPGSAEEAMGIRPSGLETRRLQECI